MLAISEGDFRERSALRCGFKGRRLELEESSLVKLSSVLLEGWEWNRRLNVEEGLDLEVAISV